MLTLNLSNKLAINGHDVSLLCSLDSRIQKEAVSINIKTIPIFNNGAKIFNSILRLKKRLAVENFDVIHTHLSHDLWTITPAIGKRHQKTKLFLTKHMGSGVSKKDIFHKYLYKRVDRIFAISSYIMQSVLETCPLDKEKVTLLHDAIPLETFNKNKFDKNAVHKELNIPEGGIIAGMVGRMTPGKGHEDLIEAAKMVIQRTNKQIYFLITGSASFGEEAYEKKIRKLAEDPLIADRMIFTGFRQDVASVMEAMDFLVFPSHLESFGLTILEAMAMELPVIASSNAGIPDIIDDGITGILIPPKNPEALSEAIMKLAGDPDLRLKLGTAARKCVEEKFDLNQSVMKLEEFYKGER
jgi:glycosyltransferase involved in cell wall biosynthesis